MPSKQSRLIGKCIFICFYSKQIHILCAFMCTFCTCMLCIVVQLTIGAFKYVDNMVDSVVIYLLNKKMNLKNRKKKSNYIKISNNNNNNNTKVHSTMWIQPRNYKNHYRTQLLQVLELVTLLLPQ